MAWCSFEQGLLKSSCCFELVLWPLFFRADSDSESEGGRAAREGLQVSFKLAAERPVGGESLKSSPSARLACLNTMPQCHGVFWGVILREQL